MWYTYASNMCNPLFLVPLHTVILLTQRLFSGLFFLVLRVHHKNLPRKPFWVPPSYAVALLCHQLLVAFYLEPHSFSSHTFFNHRHLSYKIKVVSVSIGCGGSQPHLRTSVPSVRKVMLRAREVTQRLLCKNEALSTQVKKLGMAAHACNTVPRGGDVWIPRVDEIGNKQLG